VNVRWDRWNDAWYTRTPK